jgi:hypothetical protein
LPIAIPFIVAVWRTRIEHRLVVDRSQCMVMWQAGFMKKLLQNGNLFIGKILEIGKPVRDTMRSMPGIIFAEEGRHESAKGSRTVAMEAMEKTSSEIICYCY